MLTRRTLVRAAAGFPAILAARQVRAASEYDLLIRGGRVLDPAQNLDAVRDVAIRAGKIAAVRANIPAASAAEVIEASGRLVVPGLIDIHLHARDAALSPPEILSTGVTTMVDAGSRGADNIDQLVDIARSAPNRMRILLNIGRLGNNPGGRGEFLDGLEQADTAKAAAAIQRHRQWIIGMKARLSRDVAGDRDLDVVRLALKVATQAKLPLMLHIGNTVSPLPRILELLRPGDIITHVYAPNPSGILDDRGNLLSEVRAARRRGIRFDFSNGLHEHWSWEVAERAVRQDFLPDTISTDLTVASRTEQVFDLPTVLSKFLALGMPLQQVIAGVTVNASRTFKELNPYGTLRGNAPADVTILELAEGNFEFLDNYEQKRAASRRLLTRGVILGGRRIA